MFRTTLICLYLVSLFGCQSNRAQSSFAELNSTYFGYIPVRTAVFSCLGQHRFDATQEGDQLAMKLSQEVCRRYDQFVLNGFKNQKFMRGYTPKAIDRFYQRASKRDPSRKDPKQNFKIFLNSRLSDLKGLKSGSRSSSSLKLQNVWQQPLLEFSLDIGDSDALFLPVLMNLESEQIVLHGKEVLRIQVVMQSILIDTTRNAVIWHSKLKRNLMTRDINIFDSIQKQTGSPNLDDFFADLFGDEHWINYPGRVSI